MPIRPENRDRYPADWQAIRVRILERADCACECVGECGLEHVGGRCGEAHCTPARGFAGMVVLTIAHLDHTPEHNDPSNLRALCQRCHNRYDREHRAKTRRRTRDSTAGQVRMPWMESDS